MVLTRSNTPPGKGLHNLALEEAKLFCSDSPRSFQSDAQILETARILFCLRAAIEEDWDSKKLCDLVSFERNLTRSMHKTIMRSKDNPHLVKAFRRYRLNQVEKEILLLLCLSGLGMGHRISDIEDVQSAIRKKGAESLSVIRTLSEEGRLSRTKLVVLEIDETPTSTRVQASAELLSSLTSPRSTSSQPWSVKNQEELLDRLYPLVLQLYERCENIEKAQRGAGSTENQADIDRNTRRIKHLLKTLSTTLDCHPEWPFHTLLASIRDTSQKLIVVALLGKELGFLCLGDSFFTGTGLSRAVSRSVPDVRRSIAILRKDRQLRSRGLIRVCGGPVFRSTSEDDTLLSSCEFELTDNVLSGLRVQRQRSERVRSRPAVVRMDQLVLPLNTNKSVAMILAQARHGGVLSDKWGLSSTVPCGTAVTALFHGPPGTGKTACAEAIACDLNRPILVADYSRIQDCWVGETEKNIVHLFRQALADRAVLFWDEADAMYYNREFSMTSWEVRDVNVLLQELERFTGVCILATNRRVSLDPALERRISVKVQFEKPNRMTARAIWDIILPKDLPLGLDVDLDELARADLTGGEIKNVLLNAARIALCRSPRSRVGMEDFRKAIRLENEGKWSERSRVGF